MPLSFGGENESWTEKNRYFAEKKDTNNGILTWQHLTFDPPGLRKREAYRRDCGGRTVRLSPVQGPVFVCNPAPIIGGERQVDRDKKWRRRESNPRRGVFATSYYLR